VPGRPAGLGVPGGPDGPPRRAKHLMDPDAPRERPTAADVARLERVQRWVLSVLVATTILHLSAGLVIIAVTLDQDEQIARIGLSLLGGAFGVCAVASALAFHRRSLASPWMALGLVPAVVGLVLVL